MAIFVDVATTDVEDGYPKFFTEEVWIPFRMREEAEVIINIFDSSGKLVKEIYLGKKQAGLYIDKDSAAYWRGRDQGGNLVPKGIYFYNIITLGRNHIFTTEKKRVIFKGKSDEPDFLKEVFCYASHSKWEAFIFDFSPILC